MYLRNFEVCPYDWFTIPNQLNTNTVRISDPGQTDTMIWSDGGFLSKINRLPQLSAQWRIGRDSPGI